MSETGMAGEMRCWLLDRRVKSVMFSNTQGETASGLWIVTLVVSAEVPLIARGFGGGDDRWAGGRSCPHPIRF